MRRVLTQNPSVERTYKGFISSDYSSGTVLTVSNNNSFAADDFIVIGEPSEELTEEKKISSVSGTTTINLASALNFAHPKGTSIYKVLWDNVSIESRVNAAGTFAEITLSAIQWDNKHNETVFYDSSGADATEYRFRFKESVGNTFSEYSPTITGAGFSRAQVGNLIQNVRLIVQDEKRKIVTDDELIRFFNRAQDIIYSYLPRSTGLLKLRSYF